MKISKEVQMQDLLKVERYLRELGKSHKPEAVAAVAYRAGAERGMQMLLKELGIGKSENDFAEKNCKKE